MASFIPSDQTHVIHHFVTAVQTNVIPQFVTAVRFSSVQRLNPLWLLFTSLAHRNCMFQCSLLSRAVITDWAVAN